jgi:hypothetical protein
MVEVLELIKDGWYNTRYQTELPKMKKALQAIKEGTRNANDLVTLRDSSDGKNHEFLPMHFIFECCKPNVNVKIVRLLIEKGASFNQFLKNPVLERHRFDIIKLL